MPCSARSSRRPPTPCGRRSSGCGPPPCSPSRQRHNCRQKQTRRHQATRHETRRQRQTPLRSAHPCATVAKNARSDTKRHEAKRSDKASSDATTVAEEPVYSIDYNLPIDFKLSYGDFAQAIIALDPQERRILWSQRLDYWAAVKNAPPPSEKRPPRNVPRPVGAETPHDSPLAPGSSNRGGQDDGSSNRGAPTPRQTPRVRAKTPNSPRIAAPKRTPKTSIHLTNDIKKRTSRRRPPR